jgi:hypothetical protein
MKSKRECEREFIAARARLMANVEKLRDHLERQIERHADGLIDGEDVHRTQRAAALTGDAIDALESKPVILLP